MSDSASVLPPNLDLTALNREQLDLLAQAVEKEKVAAEERRRDQVKKKITAVLEEAGLGVGDLADLFPAAGRSQKSRPAYRNPNKPSQTWTGRGRKPGWVEKHLTAGGKLDDLRTR